MISVSMCMIVKNEQSILKRCLDSYAGIYDELIIVDTGSTDNTKEIAAQYTDKVYDFAWCDDFAAARNFAFSKASCDYILSVDADEELDFHNNTALRSLKKKLFCLKLTLYRCTTLTNRISILYTMSTKNCVQSFSDEYGHSTGFRLYMKLFV